MAIANDVLTNRTDKKINYGVTRTDFNANRDVVSEAIASPLPNPSHNLWINSDLIPSAESGGLPPLVNTSDIKVYKYNASSSSVEGVFELTPDQELAYSKTLVEISEKQLIKGRVVGMNDRDVLIDIGFKSEGIIDRSEFDKNDLPQIGDQVEVYLEYIEDAGGNILGVGVLVDRSNGTVTLHNNQYSIVKLDAVSYGEDEVPDELDKIPIQKPGSRYKS